MLLAAGDEKKARVGVNLTMLTPLLSVVAWETKN